MQTSFVAGSTVFPYILLEPKNFMETKEEKKWILERQLL